MPPTPYYKQNCSDRLCTRPALSLCGNFSGTYECLVKYLQRTLQKKNHCTSQHSTRNAGGFLFFPKPYAIWCYPVSNFCESDVQCFNTLYMFKLLMSWCISLSFFSFRSLHLEIPVSITCPVICRAFPCWFTRVVCTIPANSYRLIVSCLNYCKYILPIYRLRAGLVYRVFHLTEIYNFDAMKSTEFLFLPYALCVCGLLKSQAYFYISVKMGL